MNRRRRFREFITSFILVLGCLSGAWAGSAQPRDVSARPPILESEYARWRASLPDDYPQLADYRRVLLRWIRGAEPLWRSDPQHPALGNCRFGDSSRFYGCTARTLPAYATLAADPALDDATWTREKLIDRLNSAIAFLCATYDPSVPAREGLWGKRPRRNSLRFDTWIIGNMVDVLQMARDAVTAENRQRIREILIDIVEAERTSGRAKLLDDYRHEGITWTMNLPARAAILFPEHPRAAAWLDLAKHGYASSLSVAADREDETVIDGKSIRQWVSRRHGVFHPDFTFSHHRLGIHPGYMCFASHRMPALYDLLKQRGEPLSPIWFLHYRDVTNRLKDLALWDGRLVYPNGKDWADYLYGVSCFHLHMAALQMMDDDGEARLIEQGLFRQLEWHQIKRGRGDFGPCDAEYVFNANDIKEIAFAHWYHLGHGFAQPAGQAAFDRAHGKVLHSPHSEFVAVRDPRRFVSWGWHAFRDRVTGKHRSTGLILPRGNGLGEHLAQWDDNLIADYWTSDEQGRHEPLHLVDKTNRVSTFSGGFAVSEKSVLGTKAGRAKHKVVPCVVDQRVIVALPDGRTTVVAAVGRAVDSVSRLNTSDVNWRFVRSIFSDMKRTVYHAGGEKECQFVGDLQTGWFNVDGVMSVISVGEPARLTCRLFGELDNEGMSVAGRGVFGTHSGQTVRLSVCSPEPRDYAPGESIFETCLVFVADSTASDARRIAPTCRDVDVAGPTRAWRVQGRDGRRYLVAANFSDENTAVSVPGWRTGQLLTPKSAHAKVENNGLHLKLHARGCAVLIDDGRSRRSR